MRLIADTCWYIDLDKGRPSAVAFLVQNPTVRFVLTDIVRGELAAGGRDPRRLLQLVSGADRLSTSSKVGEIWGREYRRLRAEGQMIGTNDLWIGSIALAHGLPLITRNGSEFDRISGLNVVTY